MTTLSIIAICMIFLLTGYLMGRCGGRVKDQYSQGFVEKIKSKKQVFENDPYAEALEDSQKSKGTIE